MKAIELIVVGASAGGIQAIQNLLSSLSPDFELPIVVTQHLPATADVDMSLVFQHHAKGRAIFTAEDKIWLEPKSVYLAPPGYHLLVEADRSLAVSLDEHVCFSRPSIDVLFESAALSYGDRVCGVLLTGANADGAGGLKSVFDRGGYTIVQDPLDAEASYGPNAALKIFTPHKVLPLKEIGSALNVFSNQVRVATS